MPRERTRDYRCAARDGSRRCTGRTDKFIGGVQVCQRHAAQIYSDSRAFVLRRVVRLWDENPDAVHSYGSTYIVRLPNGRIKIGMCFGKAHPKWKYLLDRWQKLSRAYGGKVQPMAVLDGGATREAWLHVRFAGLAVRAEFGEQFEPSADIERFAAAWGFTPDGVEAVARFSYYCLPS